MKSSQACKAMSIFDKLPAQTKQALYTEMLNLGLRIEAKETTWHKHARLRSRTTEGDLRRYFLLVTNFTPQDVQVFLDAFTAYKVEKMTNSRPFAVGDRIYCKEKEDSGVIESVEVDGLIVTRYGDRYFLDFDDVKDCCILPPRKGDKEARDIVAMLARHYKAARFGGRREYWTERAKITHDLFKEAKEMLK